MSDISSSFTVSNDSGAKIVSFCCDLSLYTNEDISSLSGPVINIYERFLEQCQEGRLRWFATENMTRHKAVTPRALDMLRGWLKRGAAPRPMINIHLKDSQSFDDAPEYSFWVYGCEPGGPGYGQDANSIRCTFPAVWALENPDRLLRFTEDACMEFPFTSGHAGLVLETNPYYRSESHLAAWLLSMQHPGLDISNPVTDPNRLRRDGIKGVNWLTIIGYEFAALLGGDAAIRDGLPEDVVVISTTYGLILRAGLAPRWGHVNRGNRLPEYRAVYRMVEPLQQPIVGRYTSFSLPGGDHKFKTSAWLRRFSDDI